MSMPVTNEGALLDEIRRLEERLHEPEVRASKELLSRLLADSFIEIGSSGRIYDKATIISELLNEPKSGDLGRVIAHEYTLRTLGADLVLLTYLSERHLTAGIVRRSRRSSLWQHFDGSWRMIFHQGTPSAY